MTTIERDGKRYLARKVNTSLEDGCDGYETALLEVDVARVDAWLAKLALAQRLGKEHGVDGIEFIDYAPEYYAADWEAEPLDDEETYPPLWDAKGDYDGRTECGRLFVSVNNWLMWTAYVKHTDVRLEVLSLDSDQLQELRDRLVQQEAPCS